MVKSSGTDKINQKDLQGTLHKMPILNRCFANTDPVYGLNMAQKPHQMGNLVQRGTGRCLAAPKIRAQGYTSLWPVPLKNVIRVQKKRVLLLLKFADGTKLGEATNNSEAANSSG